MLPLSLGLVITCPPPGGVQTPPGYGFSAQGTANITRWQVSYNGHTWTATGTNLPMAIQTPRGFFRAHCDNAPTTATVSFWLTLPSFGPPSGWYGPGWPGNPFPPASSTGPYPDSPGATLGPFSTTVTVAPCSTLKSQEYAVSQLKSGNFLHMFVWTGNWGRTTASGARVIAGTGQRYHFVFGLKACCGVDPYLDLKSLSARMLNARYPHLHNMFGQVLPAWQLMFSHLTPGLAGSSAPGVGWQSGAAAPQLAQQSGFDFAADWAWTPDGTTDWRQAASVSPKIVLEVASHQATVQGHPYRVAVTAQVEPEWAYYHFTVSANASCTQANEVARVPPYQETYVYYVHKKIHGKWTYAQRSRTLPVYNATTWYYPGSCGVSASPSSFYRGAYHQTMQPLTVSKVIGVAAISAFPEE